MALLPLAACGSLEVTGTWVDPAETPGDAPATPDPTATDPEPSPSATPTPAPKTIVVNEVYYAVDPDNPASDASRDGVVGPNDQFIEIVNVTSSTIPLAGLELWEGNEATPRYRWTAGDIEPGAGIVVFGGGPSVTAQCNASLLVMSTPLLLDATDRVRLERNGVVLDEIGWSVATVGGASFARTPDRTGVFGIHPPALDAFGNSWRTSPGCRVDITAF